MLNKFAYLYVEDDLLSREVMQLLMGTAMGIEKLTIFEDSRNFMDRLKELPELPKVIMLDIHMKPYTGFELLEMLREDDEYGDAIIVALTASVMSEEVEQLKRSGFDGAIAKPLSVATFPNLMSRLINGETVWHIGEI